MPLRPDRPPLPDRLELYGRTARRARRRYGFHPVGVIGPANPRPVFVVGCPRSGTTFTAKAIGRAPDFVDLGEVPRVKQAIPDLYRLVNGGAPDIAVHELRRIIRAGQRVAMAARKRVIEQTPESTFLIRELADAFPQAHFVYLLRDGRDVAASLIERGWLAGSGRSLVAARGGGERLDDAGHPFGGYARFWVEEGREQEFEQAAEARRCAWAWRRYNSAAQDALGLLPPERVTTLRYEQLMSDPTPNVRRLADRLEVRTDREGFVTAFHDAHPRSIGRYVDALDEDQIQEIQSEAGQMLADLDYLDPTT